MYNQALMTNPLETKLATGGILAFAGDFIAQSRDDADYDVKRAGAIVSFDMMYRAMQCALFPEIVRVCDGHHLGSFLQGVDISVLATLEQTMTNQFIIIPLVYYPLFFSLTGYVQGLSIDATIERAQSTIVPLLKRNWTFWLPVQYFQFGYVNEPLQIPFLCVVGLAWTFILSVAAGSVQTYNEANDSVQIYNTAYLEEENMSFYKQNNATLSTV
jgi:protein Mpv17